MGVHGLWKLIEPSGKIVPLDTLENKVLAVDVSIWLHQALKGFQDARGNAVPNAHLLGLFHRICKLLFYRIKPVFVFDGGVPHLKRQTVAARRQQKSRAEQRSEQAREKLLRNIVKHKALRKVLGLGQAAGDVGTEPSRSQQADDMFLLPPTVPCGPDQDPGGEQHDEEEDEEDDALEEVVHEQHYKDLHSINVNSEDFKALPANVRHDILSELKETRKQSSWGRLHEIPKESGEFSSYQMARLLKRRSVQVSLEEAEKEMGGRTLSLGELEELLSDQGVVLASDLGRRIASDNVTRYLYVKESKEGESKRSSQADSSSELSELGSSPEKPGTSKSEAPLQVGETNPTVTKDIGSFDAGSVVSQSEVISSDDNENENVDAARSHPLLQVARDFMLENSSLTQQQILSIIKHQNSPKKSGDASPEVSPTVSKTNNVVDENKVDSENLGVTQKEILAMIQAELVRCKELLEAESKGQLEEGTSANGEAGIVGIIETDKLPGLPAVADSSTKVGPAQELHIVTTDVCLSPDKESPLHDVAGGKDSLESDEDEMASNFAVPPEGVRVTSDDDSDGEFIEVMEQQVNNVSESQEALPKQTNPTDAVLTEAEVTMDDDIFADVFSTADTKELDEIVGKLNKSSRVASKNLDIGGSVAQEIISSSVTSQKKVLEAHLKSNLTEIFLESADMSLKEDTQDEQSKHEVSTEEENKNTSRLENENPSNGVVPASKPEEKLSLEELRLIQVNLEEEQTTLVAERGKQDRIAASITDQMYLEAQELLQLFGVPYIVAPMEAEAQCAFLDLMSLTDGTITDDSDIWLFGGQRVYKNFFNHKKQVLQFQATDIHHYFKLSRQQLILLALLVGSDYTVGLPGVGPVTALEILGLFPCKRLDQDAQGLLQGLHTFRDWLKSGVGMGPSKAALRSKLRNILVHEGGRIQRSFLVGHARPAFSSELCEEEVLLDEQKN
ncbi:DNA excision repair protein ERCC-5 isoform X2 [Bacillus rossius redtenbacheri]|uniref:DNA excision repair protein ERCC-5 isoform X2 n=1 Tax=Bacillus rossius redtenbacheri TaxID=93214 RepID=UPI002FDD23F1